MKTFKKILHHVFIDGLSGMALGLFATLIVGTILEQIGKGISALSPEIGTLVIAVAGVAKAITGAGIGIGIACKFKQPPLVAVSASVAGMVGAFSSKIIAGKVLAGGALTLAGAGDPLGAFIAAMVGIEVGRLVSGKTGIDILLTPMVTILSGSAVGLLVGPPITSFTNMLGELINWATYQQPFLMGIVVSVVMGIVLTLPISSAALGVILGLSGISAGAAAVGCSCQMVGFAVQSFRENKWSGLISQGVGTSMIQMPNIVRKPVIWLPPIIASAILGPVSTCLFKMVNNKIGSGMGTSGLVGQIMGYKAMTEAGFEPMAAILEIVAMHVIFPAILTLIISELMRKWGIIKEGDMKLSL